ncbi:MAG: AAA family ATPase [Chloroflexi bacterium]|jgi:chromosome partitioning protein|nr:AAA family ATPase [Chloroflexota bacterium]
MTKFYAVANQKGGVGKTTSVINLAAVIGTYGLRTLVVDLDPQANATSGLGYNKHEFNRSTYDLLLEQVEVEGLLIRNAEFGLDVLPANPALAGAEIELVNLAGREYRLQQALSAIDGQYDYVLIDCPPSLGLLTINALATARDGILIPVQCEYLALEGLTQLLQTIQLVQKFLNPKLLIRGLIMTMYDSRTNLSRQVVQEVRQHFQKKVFRTIIPRNVRLGEAPSYGQPINVYAPKSAGAVAYRLLTAELLKGDHIMERSR